MNLKEQIQKDFIQAMKSKDVDAKRAISSLKAKITEAEKANKNTELNDSEIVKVVNSALKQRKQSYEDYIKFDRMDLADVEMRDINIIEKYLPTQMDEVQITKELTIILSGLIGYNLPTNALIGKSMGEFNKKFIGRADMKVVSKILNELISG